MKYLMSDIHGCYDKYIAMIKKINLGRADVLYVLGDVLDRGPEGFKILLDMASRENVVILRGNHDQQAGVLLSNLYMLDEDECPRALVELYEIWLADGGKTSLAEYLSLPEVEQQRVIRIISGLKNSIIVTVNNERFLLAHTVPGIEQVGRYPDWTMDDYIMGEPDYDKVYFDDMYIVTGHTPTGFIDNKYVGKIWKGNKHIAIDCGAVYGKHLGCICLDTMEEFYV